MKYFLFLFIIFSVILHGQPFIPVTIIDDHVENYESTTFKICFDGNGDLRDLDYIPHLSSIERPDIQNVLEAFYLSPKFKSQKKTQNQCMLSSAVQVNSKFETSVAEKETCKKFQTGTFIYGRTNFSGNIIRREKGRQHEIGQEGEITADVIWQDECSYQMLNPVLPNYLEPDSDVKINSSIIYTDQNAVLLKSTLENERHFIEMIQLNSPSFNPENSELLWRAFKIIENAADQEGGHFGTLKIRDAVIHSDATGIKYLNAVIDLNSIDVLDIEERENAEQFESHMKSDDFFNTELYPNATFRLLHAEEITGDYSHRFTGILRIKELSQQIDFKVNINKNRRKISLISEEIILKPSDFDLLPVPVIKDEMVIRFHLEFEK